MHDSLPLFAGKPHDDVGDEGFRIKDMDDMYTDDLTTCAGIRAQTYAYIAQVTCQDGTRAMTDMIASHHYRVGAREMDRLELAHDLEGMKTFGRAWLQELTALAAGRRTKA